MNAYCNLHRRLDCTLCDECGHESDLHDNAWSHPEGSIERERIFDQATCWAENICSACAAICRIDFMAGAICVLPIGHSSGHRSAE